MNSTYELPERISMLVLLLTTAAVSWHCVRELNLLPKTIQLPMGGCRHNQPVARIEQGRLKLSGEVDTEGLQRIRAAARQVWWVSGVDDALTFRHCELCEVGGGFSFKAIRFDTDLPKPETRPQLPASEVLSVDAIVERVWQCPDIRLTVLGFADLRWSEKLVPLGADDDKQSHRRVANDRHNTDLSWRRANAVADRLQNRLGKKVSRIGKGSTREFTPEEFRMNELSTVALAANRRAEVKLEVVKGEEMESLFPPAWAYTLFWGFWLAIGALGLMSGVVGSILVLKRFDVLRTEREYMRGKTRTTAARENRLEIIEGIGPYYANQIESQCDVKTISELACLEDYPMKIQTIAAMHPPPAPSGAHLPSLGENRVRSWIAMAKLIQLPTVTKDWAELLIASGVMSVEQLARQDRDVLYRKVRDVNQERNRIPERRLAVTEPTELEIAYMIDVAKDSVRTMDTRTATVPLLARLLRLKRTLPRIDGSNPSLNQ